MKWVISFFLILAWGCSSPNPLKIQPPAKSKTLPFSVAYSPEIRLIRIGWGDCSEPVPGQWYEVWRSTNLVDWEKFEMTFNHFIDIPCSEAGLNVFKVRASVGNAWSEWGGPECPQ